MPKNASDLSRRRVYTILAVFIIFISIVALVLGKSNPILEIIAKVPILIIAIILLVLIFLWKDKISYSNLERQNNIMTIIFLVMLVFQIFVALVNRDSAELGYDVSSIAIMVLGIANRIF